MATQKSNTKQPAAAATGSGENKAADQSQAEAKAQQEKEQQDKDKQPEKVDALFIRSSRKGGHRRAGHRFTRDGVGIALDAITDAQRAQIEGDPCLVVEQVEVDA